ncbi:hypothetical protein [Nostoc sp. 'Peltigera malacea cyanobiont' DB3992]|uniref:hypothetical protein n=1 Tax=Nostoc sp. 'Peltigera malacea cyanobiont' DB3992 TaxID=1206980 RepID=UPI0015D4CD62|nr:hypothetical protein [Nostoc sp. 'Peltigera malacea cyanobiont' DB3992]
MHKFSLDTPVVVPLRGSKLRGASVCDTLRERREVWVKSRVDAVSNRPFNVR